MGNGIAWRMPPHASMARLRRAGREDSVLDGVSPASLGDFGLIPSSLGGEGQGEGSVTALPGECRPTCEWHGFAVQDTRARPSTGFRPPASETSVCSPLPLGERVKVRGR